ncbi:uncharacterized protein LOC142893599 [Nelusetta ayraudi]|uniref:uncharacterized protein LOC142893599 n=1 Tax=Nelusetta ayraudi TaxID=303726 RepID=UPI003F71C94E
MDPDSPASRVGRSLWTVWSYITEAVSRFFRSESTNISENNPGSDQQSENLTANTTWRTKCDAGREEVKEEHALASVCQLPSRSVVEWELCVTDADAQAHEGDAQYKTQQGKDDESGDSQQAQGSREGEFAQAVDKNAGVVTADIEGKGEWEDKMLCRNRRIEEALDSNEFLQTVYTRLTHGAMTEDVEKDGSTKSEESPEEDAVAQGEDENLLESSDAEEKDERHLEDLTAEDNEVDLNMAAALNKDRELIALMKEKILQNFEEGTPPLHKNVYGTDAVLFFDSGNDGARQGGNQLLSSEKSPEKEQDQSIPEASETEGKPEVITERENATEQEEDTEPVPEEPQSFSADKCSKELAITELERVECTDGEQVDTSTYSEVQTKRKSEIKIEASDEEEDEKSDLDTTDFEVEEGCVDNVQTEEVEPSGDVCNDDKHTVDATCVPTSSTLNSEDEGVKETSGKFKNISSWVCEGQLVVPQESPLCEEARRGVPEHNNEPGGDENTTQRFLEEQDSRETHTMELPEEVESAHSSVGSHSTDYLSEKERVAEEQDSSGDIRCGFSLDAAEHIGGPCLNEAELPRNVETPQGEQEIQEVPAGSWKAEDTCSVLAGESHLTDGTTKKQPDETEELSYETQMDDLKEADAAGREEGTDTEAADEVVQFADEILKALEVEVQKMTEISFHKEYDSVVDLEQSSCSVPSLQEKPCESTECALFEDRGEDFHSVETKQMEKAKYAVEEDTQEDHLERKKSQQHIDITTEWDEILERLSAESETVETQNQLWDEAQGLNSEEDEVEPKTKDKHVMPTEETDVHAKHIEDPFVEPDVIDDEILDLWLQTTLSEDADDIIVGEGPQSGKQVDGEIKQWEEEPGEISTVLTEKNEEPLVEFSSGDFNSSNDAEMPLATVESGSRDPEPMTSTEKDSTDEVYHMSVHAPQPADPSEPTLPQPDSGSEDTVRVTTAEKGQSYVGEVESVTEDGLHSDSGLNSPTRLLNEDLEETDEKSAEEGGSENVDVEDAELHLLTKPNPLFSVEDPAVEDERLSDSLDEIEQPESDEYESGPEESQEANVLDTESALPEWSDGEFLSGSNRTDVEEELTLEFGDLIEGDASTLDCAAQRSRIFVKNPRVRPPKDPRTLLNMPSLEPTPPPQHRVPAGLPMGGLGLGIKLPGLGAGFPVLKRVEQKHEPETKLDEMDDKSKEDEAQHKPKWMPPRHPGLGNPLMSELKAKLKKTPPDN